MDLQFRKKENQWKKIKYNENPTIQEQRSNNQHAKNSNKYKTKMKEIMSKVRTNREYKINENERKKYNDNPNIQIKRIQIIRTNQEYKLKETEKNRKVNASHQPNI